MYSNVNEVVQQVHLADRGGYRFWIDWRRSCYRDETRKSDPWAYYFEPVWPDLPRDPADPQLPGGGPVATTRDNLITPRLIDGAGDPLLLPKDRHRAGMVVNRAIRLNAMMRDHVAELARSLGGVPEIGLHIRGPGRTDGGADRLRRMLPLEDGIPFQTYFAAVDDALGRWPSARIFACSDSDMVLARIVARYGAGRVLSQAAHRSLFGEMHANHPENAGQIFPPFALGREVVADAELLAQTRLFIHGNSNLANFVLCRAPDLDSHYVYGALPHRLPDA
jgi:hypothetical protein